jgi:hypothetical protein
VFGDDVGDNMVDDNVGDNMVDDNVSYNMEVGDVVDNMVDDNVGDNMVDDYVSYNMVDYLFADEPLDRYLLRLHSSCFQQEYLYND